MAELTQAPIDFGARLASAARPEAGAIAAFLGTTRDHHQGRAVVGLAYEAYEPMAVAALERLEAEARRRFAVLDCAIVHRLGEVPIAEPSVLVVAVAAHRGPAFEACRWAMDELKRSVPIWKKERFAGGDEAWVEGEKLEPPQS